MRVRRGEKKEAFLVEIGLFFSFLELRKVLVSWAHMRGLSRLGSGVSTPSPPSSPRYRRKNSPVGGGGGSFRGGVDGGVKLHNFAEKLGFMLVSAVYRRRGVLLFAPLLYISGMLLYMGTFGFDGGRGGKEVAPPGSVYRSPQVFEKLWPHMQAENNGSSNLVNLLIFLVLLKIPLLRLTTLFDCDLFRVFEKCYFLTELGVWSVDSIN